MSLSYDRELQVGIAAIKEAAQLCRAVRAGLGVGAPRGVLAKADSSPVTIADFGSQALICRALHSAFAADAIVAEEDAAELREPANAAILEAVLGHVSTCVPQVDASALCNFIDSGRTRTPCERFWTLDPIDGTKGFLRGGQYAISLALLVGGRIEVAVVGCPSYGAAGSAADAGTIYYATRGGGAWVQSLEGETRALPVRVSSQRDPAQARLCESVESGHSAHDEAAAVARRLGISAPPLRMDSQVKYAAVAHGAAEIYLRMPTRADYREKIWDHAGGALVVAEAGGTVSDLDGRPLDFAHGRELCKNRGVLVSNGLLHEQILSALAQGA